MSLPPQTILVLGGGVGGVSTAVLLRERLGAKHRVILVEREAAHVFAPSLLWMLVGERAPETIARPMTGVATRGVELIRGEVEAVDAEARVVTVDGQRIAADWLVVALGAELAPELVPGLALSGHNIYTVEGAIEFASALQAVPAARVALLTAAPGYKCPAAPYEAAMLVQSELRKRTVEPRVDLYTAEPGPMGVAGPEVSAAVRQMVEEKGIGYHPEHVVTGVSAGRLEFANGASASFDLLGFVPPHRPPSVVRESSLAGPGGWIEVDRGSLATRFPGVYAIGDNTQIPLTMGRPLPRAGVFAHGQAEAVAKTIARSITGRGKAGVFEGHGECFIETGEGKAGFGRGNFYAEPRPQVAMHAPAWHWHAAKVAFEKYWLRRWF